MRDARFVFDEGWMLLSVRDQVILSTRYVFSLAKYSGLVTLRRPGRQGW